MARYNLETKTPEEWRHLWEYNPEFVRLGGQWPIGWVLEHPLQDIVGYFGNVPLAYEFQGKRLIAAATHGWVVDTTHRNSTLLLVHRYFSQKTVDLFVNASANYQAGKIFEAMHGRRTPSPRSDVALFWVTDYPQFVSSLLQWKRIPAAHLLKHSLGGLMWGHGQIRSGVEKVLLRNHLQPANIQPVTQFDERFDEFWARLRRADGELLRCVRDCQALDWHFRHALAKGDAWIFVELEGSAISAYSVFVRQDNRAVGLKRVRLVDFQCLDTRCKVLLPMISAALARCRAEGVHVLESIGFGARKRAILEEHAPYSRRLPAWMFLYKARSRDLDQQLTKPGLWDVCAYDGDGSL